MVSRFILVLFVVLSSGCDSNAPQSVRADFDAGLAAYERGDYKTAVQEFRQLAEQGHAEAQNNLGVMYLTGQGVPSKEESWAIYYNGHQYLSWEDGRGWGLFVRAGVSDDDTNVIDSNVAVGLGGTGFFDSRPHEVFHCYTLR